MNQLEEGEKLQLDFSKLKHIAETSQPVLPVVVQNIETNEVILLAYTNATALRRSLSERRLILWSTSRNEIWEKGKTSGKTFELIEAFVNCEQNSLLYLVRADNGGICHTSNRNGSARNCFYRRINPDSCHLENIDP